MKKIRVICCVCGASISGVVPKNGDGSEWRPRKHRINGEICEGTYMEGLWLPDKNK
jgi:cytochrome c5